MGSVAREWKMELQDLSDEVELFASDQDQVLKETRSKVDRYVSEEIRKDIPTGYYNH